MKTVKFTEEEFDDVQEQYQVAFYARKRYVEEELKETFDPKEEVIAKVLEALNYAISD